MTDNMHGMQSILNNSYLSGGAYKTQLTQNWKQGRTAYGGLTLALAYEAAAQNLSALPPLRSVQINFVGPVTNDPVFTAQILRQGRNVTTALVTGFTEGGFTEGGFTEGGFTEGGFTEGGFTEGGFIKTGDGDTSRKIIASANFIFGAARKSEISENLAAPAAPIPETTKPETTKPETTKPEDYPPFTPEFAKPLVPQFFHNFDTRLIAGARPVSGASEGYIRTWSRHKDTASRKGIASLLCISDVLPPAAMPMLKKMGPVSSVNFTLNILVDDPQTDDGWWQIETRQSAAQGGYSSQIMRIWNTNGVLVAEGMQCVAIFV